MAGGIVAVASCRGAAGAGPADPLFRLIPPGSSVVLAVEDLRGRLRQVEGTSLGADLRRLPMVASWIASARFDRFRTIARAMERGLGVPVRDLVDEVFGDAFALALQAGPDDRVDQSSGLLLVRPRRADLLERALETRNQAQAKYRGLLRVEAKRHGAAGYFSRHFRPGGGRSDDHYAFLADGTFAWSNTEATILDVIDRQAGARPGFDSIPHFARLRQGLPATALASLFVDPRVVAAVVTGSLPLDSAARRRLDPVASAYFRAVRATGFALEWRDGFVFHSHEVVAPDRLPPWLAAWMAHPPGASPLVGLVPPTAFAVASARVDFAEALRAARALVAADDRLAWDSFEQAARGMALGRPLDDLAAALDPHVLLAIGPGTGTAPRGWFDLLGAATWGDAAKAQAPWLAADNALRTAMATAAFRPYRRAHGFRVETQTRNGRPVARLGTADRTVLACQVEPDRVLIANSVEAIGAGDGPATEFPPSSPLADLRSRYAADAETFAICDLDRLAAAIARVRVAIVRELAGRSGRPVAEVDRDFGQFLALAGLFRAATFTSRANAEATEVHRTLGLIAR